MNDYPRDGGKKMSEVWNGYKMLLDGPQGISTPTVKVHNEIFFVNELLQREDRSYFIPERFFAEATALPDTRTSTALPEKIQLMAIGRNARKLEVSGQLPHLCSAMAKFSFLGRVCCRKRANNLPHIDVLDSL